MQRFLAVVAIIGVHLAMADVVITPDSGSDRDEGRLQPSHAGQGIYIDTETKPSPGELIEKGS